MKRLKAASATAILAVALTHPATATAAFKSADTSIPVDAVTTLEMHTTADCVPAETRCHFTARANLLTPDGPVGFPDGLWARQTTTLRSNSRDVWQEAGYSAPPGTPRETKGGNYDNTLSKMFKALNSVEITTVYFGGGPAERYQVVGDSTPTDWSTGRPNTEADFIVCSHIQVVYAGVNLTSPSTCAQTGF